MAIHSSSYFSYSQNNDPDTLENSSGSFLVRGTMVRAGETVSQSRSGRNQSGPSVAGESACKPKMAG